MHRLSMYEYIASLGMAVKVFCLEAEMRHGRWRVCLVFGESSERVRVLTFFGSEPSSSEGGTRTSPSWRGRRLERQLNGIGFSPFWPSAWALA